MSDGIRRQFEALADHGEPGAMLRQLEGYIEARPDVGRSIDDAGLVSFESVYSQVKAIHDRWSGGRS